MFEFFKRNASKLVGWEEDSALDLSKVSYNPEDVAHTEYLRDKICHLNELYTELFKSDMKIAVPYSADTLLWFAGVYGVGITLTLATMWSGYVYATKEHEYQQDCQGKFHTQLRELLDIYHAAILAHGPKITKDEDMMKLLTAIGPFVPTEQLLCWSLYNKNPADMSEGFKHLLMAAPHRVPSAFLQCKEATLEDAVDKAFTSATKGYIQLVRDKVSSNNAVKLGFYAASEGKRALFGINDADHSHRMTR